MKHNYIDEYSNLNSLIHSLDPRIKIISLFTFILFVLFTRPISLGSFALYGALIIILILLSRIPFGFILKRSLVIIPFVLMVAIFIPFFKRGDGLAIFLNVLAKSCLSILCMILLVASTGFVALLKAFERLGCPKLITMILSFMYRYIFVIQDELMKMHQAKEARSIGRLRWIHTKALANMVGTLFIRTYERGESVYLAMCSRGFAGDIRTIDVFQLSKKDIFFFLIIIVLLTGIRLVGA